MASILDWFRSSGTKIDELQPKEESSRGSNQLTEGFKRKVVPEQNINTKEWQVLDDPINSINNQEGLLRGAMYSNASSYASNSKLMSEMSSSASNKESLLNKLNSIREYDYIESILRDVATDVLTRNFDHRHGNFFQFTTTNHKAKKFEKSINDDLKRLRVYENLASILEDLLFTGQYIFKIDYANDELDDGLVQEKVLPTYSKTSLYKVYNVESKKLEDPEEFLIFTLFTSHKRLKVKSESGSYYHVRLPKGIIPESIIGKINNLRLLEAIQPLIELQAIDEKMYFQIRFPPGKDMTEAYQETMDYEKLLKSMLSMDNIKSIDELADRVSRVKVIPLFGTQNEMSQQTINKVNRMDLQQINDLRDSISNALKININGDNKTNIEYFRLIKRIRDFIRSSVSEFLIHYISRKYKLELTQDEFILSTPALKGIDELDQIEYMNLYQDTYKNTIEMITETAETITNVMANPYIDKLLMVNALSDKIFELTGNRFITQYTKVTDIPGYVDPSKVEEAATAQVEENLGTEASSDEPSEEVAPTPEIKKVGGKGNEDGADELKVGS